MQDARAMDQFMPFWKNSTAAIHLLVFNSSFIHRMCGCMYSTNYIIKCAGNFLSSVRRGLDTACKLAGLLCH